MFETIIADNRFYNQIVVALYTNNHKIKPQRNHIIYSLDKMDHDIKIYLFFG